MHTYHFYAKTHLGVLKILSETSSFQFCPVLSYNYNLLKYFFKNAIKKFWMSVEVYNSCLCKNTFGLFVKFEQTILFSFLVQIQL